MHLKKSGITAEPQRAPSKRRDFLQIKNSALARRSLRLCGYPRLIEKLRLDHLFGQFSVVCEGASAVLFSSEIAGAIPSSKITAAAPSRLTEILTEKVVKALLRTSF